MDRGDAWRLLNEARQLEDAAYAEALESSRPDQIAKALAVREAYHHFVSRLEKLLGVEKKHVASAPAVRAAA